MVFIEISCFVLFAIYFLVISVSINPIIGIGGMILFFLLWKKIIRKIILTNKGIFITLLVNFLVSLIIFKIYASIVITLILFISLLIQKKSLKEDLEEEKYVKRIKNREENYKNLYVKSDKELYRCIILKEFVLDI